MSSRDRSARRKFTSQAVDSSSLHQPCPASPCLNRVWAIVPEEQKFLSVSPYRNGPRYGPPLHCPCRSPFTVVDPARAQTAGTEKFLEGRLCWAACARSYPYAYSRHSAVDDKIPLRPATARSLAARNGSAHACDSTDAPVTALPRLLGRHLCIHPHCFAPSLASTHSTILHICTFHLCDGLEPLTVCSSRQGCSHRSQRPWLDVAPIRCAMCLIGRSHASARRCERWPMKVRDPSFAI